MRSILDSGRRDHNGSASVGKKTKNRRARFADKETEPIKDTDPSPTQRHSIEDVDILKHSCQVFLISEETSGFSYFLLASGQKMKSSRFLDFQFSIFSHFKNQ